MCSGSQEDCIRPCCGLGCSCHASELHVEITAPAMTSAMTSASASAAAERPVQRRDFISRTHATSYPYISPLSQDLSGRHVLITGAAWEHGVGYATATAFARAGASGIAVIDLHGVSDELVSRLKAAAVDAGRPEPQIVASKVDISQLDSVLAFRDVLSEAFNNRLDVVVNNAAHQEPYSSILDADPDTYWKTWEVNVHGLFNMTRAFLPMQLATRKNHGGLATMINVSSSGALSVRKGGASYRTSKLAVLRWTEALNEEHGEDGLVAFCVNPGAIKTQMTVNEPEELRNKLPHKPEIAGDTIAWLAGGRREWLGGRYVSCPWDMEELTARKDEIVAGDKLKLRMNF
jgi:NAD(P)-dependent dehydrogenase (short-subunit alcohol dehydrogenase family)